MITFNGQTYAFDDPLVLTALGGAALVLLLFILLIVTLRAAARSARMTEPLGYHLTQLGNRVQSLSDGQQQLSGGLTHVSEAQAASQTRVLQL
ncbi:MAG: DNA recombination protein RmuC, partial [Albidovulum sp.]